MIKAIKKAAIFVVCILTVSALAFGQDGKKQSVQPAQGALVAESNPAPSLDASARSASDADEAAKESTEQPSTPPAPPIPPFLIRMGQIGSKYDKLAPWDWDVLPFPSVGDSVFGEAGGVRESLAKHNIFFSLFQMSGFYDNLKDSPMYGAAGQPYNQHIPKGTIQQYTGQRPTWNDSPFLYVTYTIPSTNTQFVGAIDESWTTWEQGQGSDSFRITDLHLNQYFFKKRLKVMLGYFPGGYETVGIYTGGSLAVSLLGIASILPNEVGENAPMNMTPNAMVRYEITKHYYGVTGIQRSMSPSQTDVSRTYHDPLYMPFSVRGAKAFLTEELGYKRASAPGVKNLWVRLDGFYNYSHFFDYRKGPLAFLTASTLRQNTTDNNFATSAAIDYQVTQPDKSLPFRGFYTGFTTQYAPPQQNLFTQYYGWRGYYMGMFRNRPFDMLSLQISNTEFSKIALRTFMSMPISIPATMLGQKTSSSGQTNIGAQWTTRLRTGVYANVGLEYTVHPTPTPTVPNSLVGIVGLFTSF